MSRSKLKILYKLNLTDDDYKTNCFYEFNWIISNWIKFKNVHIFLSRYLLINIIGTGVVVSIFKMINHHIQ